MIFCFILFLPLLPVLGEEEVEDLTGQCTLTSSLKNSYWIPRVTDLDLSSAQHFGENGFVQVSWKEDVPVQYIYMEWKDLPESFTLLRYDGAGNLLSEEQGDCTLLHQIFYAGEGVQAMRFQGDNLNLSTLQVCGDGAFPENYRPWEPLTGKLDYLIVATHPDDDTLFMGGIAPTLSNKGLRGTIVYLATRDRRRCTEALNGAWEMGVRVTPVLAGFPDVPNRAEFAEVFETYFREYSIARYLVSLLRQYQPEVVFTHDVNGEYGHWQHKRCSAAVRKAVEKASDPTFDAASTREYGVWTVKKLYLHLYEQNPIHISMTEPLETYGGRTAFDMAAEAFQQHISQLGGRHACTNRGVYSLEDFGLYYTAVGLDTEGDDFMEHIAPVTLSNYVAPTAEPTAEPTIEPAIEPTVEPAMEPAIEPTMEPVPADTPAPKQTAAEGKDISGIVLGAAILLLALSALGFAKIHEEKKADQRTGGKEE